MSYKEFDIPLDLQDNNSMYSKVDEDVVYIILNLDKPKRKARKISRLSHQEKELFTAFLQVNRDVCTLSAIYMPRIDPLIIYHHLYVYLTIKSVV
ncbi:disease resistance protein RPM1-like [Pyrus ussuriensis x Pyrus communis]|uniref:Disease resistance protein RPM1-like n=1 Tax=Pyrus ussuriensis x Pyrus communis TaxID=2448454 RepID=A0A5N5HY64_9ROSA|nr:disease resistance protein RPM1-like [Pyrus ussuriensis x Pyrus communis]